MMQRRNDRCQCGSGKKFKHCHGKPPMLLPENNGAPNVIGKIDIVLTSDMNIAVNVKLATPNPRAFFLMMMAVAQSDMDKKLSAPVDQAAVTEAPPGTQVERNPNA